MDAVKFGIVSDSHGDIKSLCSVLDFFNNNNVKNVIHLGDDIKDVSIFEGYNFEVFSVPGTRDQGYFDYELRTKTIQIVNRNISLSHLKECSDENAHIILFGHTHKPTCYIENNKLFLNPGHVVNNSKRYPISTFAVLELNEKISVYFYNLNKELFEKKEFLL